MSERTVLRLAVPPVPYYLECGKQRYAVGQQHPNRKGYGVFDILFVTKGTLFIGESGREWALAAGDMLILLPDRYHYAVKPCEVETEFYWVHFEHSGDWEERQGEAVVSNGRRGAAPKWHAWFAPRSIFLPKSGPTPLREQTYRCLEQLERTGEGERFSAFWAEQQRFMELLQLLEEGRKPNDASRALQVAKRTEAYIEAHYAEPLTNDALSRALHFHPNYITRCMKTYYHCTPMEYLLACRIDRAKLLLAKTNDSIADVAAQVGFQYPPHFSNSFRRLVGVTPMQYRKRFSK